MEENARGPVRAAERTKRRTPCAVTLDGRRHNGFVLDFSLSGLFIQTSAQPRIGQRLDVELAVGGRSLPMHVEVARRKAVPPQLLTVAHGGIGVRILSAPEEFYQLIADLQGMSLAEVERRSRKLRGGGRPAAEGRATEDDDEEAPRSDLPQFRVRVRQTQGTRTRTLRVHCAGPEEAGPRALEELGEGWKVLEVEPVG